MTHHLTKNLPPDPNEQAVTWAVSQLSTLYAPARARCLHSPHVVPRGRPKLLDSGFKLWGLIRTSRALNFRPAAFPERIRSNFVDKRHTPSEL